MLELPGAVHSCEASLGRHNYQWHAEHPIIHEGAFKWNVVLSGHVAMNRTQDEPGIVVETAATQFLQQATNLCINTLYTLAVKSQVGAPSGFRPINLFRCGKRGQVASRFADVFPWAPQPFLGLLRVVEVVVVWI